MYNVSSASFTSFFYFNLDSITFLSVFNINCSFILMFMCFKCCLKEIFFVECERVEEIGTEQKSEYFSSFHINFSSLIFEMRAIYALLKLFDIVLCGLLKIKLRFFAAFSLVFP